VIGVVNCRVVSQTLRFTRMLRGTSVLSDLLQGLSTLCTRYSFTGVTLYIVRVFFMNFIMCTIIHYHCCQINNCLWLTSNLQPYLIYLILSEYYIKSTRRSLVSSYADCFSGWNDRNVLGLGVGEQVTMWSLVGMYHSWALLRWWTPQTGTISGVLTFQDQHF